MKQAAKAGQAGLARLVLTGRRWVGVALTLSLLGGAGAAQAGAGAGGLDEADQAYAAFQALVAQTQPRGDMPRLSDAGSSAVLDRLWDRQGILGGPPYTGNDVDALQQVIGLEAKVLTAYIKAGQVGSDAASAAGDSSFEAEISASEAFLVTASPALLEAAADAISKSLDLQHLTDDQKQRLKSFGSGLDGIVTEVDGAISTISDSGFSAANQKVIADALAQSGARLAVQLTPRQRTRVIKAAAKAIPAADPTAAAGLETLIGSMATTDCSAICEAGEIADGVSALPAPAAPQAPSPAPSAPQQAAVEAGSLLVPHPEVGALYGSVPAYACPSKTAPANGAISADIARQYFICETDSWSKGQPLFLVTNVRIEVGKPLSNYQHMAEDADLNSPPYPIRGSFDEYMCAPLAGSDGVALLPHNCTVSHHRQASGTCYRTGGFDEWSCHMQDPNAEQVANQPPPGPLSAAQLARAQQAAPVGALSRGVQLFARGDYAGASQAFQTVLNSNGLDPLAALWKGVLAAQKGDIWADFSLNVGEGTYPASSELLALHAWSKGDVKGAKTFLDGCVHDPERAAAAQCAGLEQKIASGAAAPAVKDWPATVGLLAATTAITGAAAPAN